MSILISNIANIVGVPASLLLAICYTESGLINPPPRIDGKTYTFGVCQVKNIAAKHMGFDNIDLNVPVNNIFVSAMFLKYQIGRYNYSYKNAIIAYNAGSYREDYSKAYLNKVLIAWKNQPWMKYGI